jgi:hypothetical protein
MDRSTGAMRQALPRVPVRVRRVADDSVAAPVQRELARDSLGERLAESAGVSFHRDQAGDGGATIDFGQGFGASAATGAIEQRLEGLSIAAIAADGVVPGLAQATHGVSQLAQGVSQQLDFRGLGRPAVNRPEPHAAHAQPPASAPHAPAPAGPAPGAHADPDALYETLIGRLRRDLLVERERTGDLLGDLP